jgi:hypothetical protein
MNTIHLPIRTLIDRVNKMKVNLSGLPLEYTTKIINQNINNDLGYISKELQTILEEIKTYVKEKENNNE